MPNETQIECYFKSADLAKLCNGSKHIVINFKASYSKGASSKFEISASALKDGAKAGKSIKSVPLSDSTSGSTTGCPTPCK